MKSAKNRFSRIDNSKRQDPTDERVKPEGQGSRFVIGIVLSCFIVLTSFAAPEGAIRDGDFLPIALFLFLLFTVIAFIARKRRATLSDTQSFSDRPLVLVADVGLGLFLLWATLSYLKASLFRLADVRLATNAFWTFVTPSLIYVLLRLYRSIISQRLLISLCLLSFSCAVIESSYSAYCYTVKDPRIREEYKANPDKMLKESGLSFAPNSRERELFEKRLLESTEPTGTYGLANTLAGFLTPWLLFGLCCAGQTCSRFRRSFAPGSAEKEKRVKILASLCVWSFCVFLVLGALVLTKSRSGFLSTAFGCGLLGLFLVARKAKWGPRSLARSIAVIAIGGSLVFVVLLIASIFGFIDKEVFTEAGKSLGYRLDYWRATAAMIRDRPLLGIGPGEFQNVYPQYILPTASEFIADPHNFAFELSALFGVPAFVFFSAFAVGALFCGLGSSKDGLDQESLVTGNIEMNASSNKFQLSGAVVGSALGAIVLSFCALFQETPVDSSFLFFSIIALPALVFVLSKATSALDKSRFAKSIPLILSVGAISLLLNLCFAGGIGYPVISTTFFFIAGIEVNQRSANASEKSKSNLVKTPFSLAFVTVLLLLFVFYLTALKPRNQSFLFMRLRDTETLGASKYSQDLKDGAYGKIDALSSKVAEQFYYYSGYEFARERSESSASLRQKMREHVCESSPNSPTVREDCGNFDWSVYCQSPNSVENEIFLDSAIDFFREAASLSPTDVQKRVKLVRALRK